MGSLEVERILIDSERLGVAGLDTAPIYGNSEFEIGSAPSKPPRIYSKFSELFTHQGQIATSVESSLDRLNVNLLAGLTFHNALDFLRNSSVLAAEALRLHNLGLIGGWGVSVYSPDELYTVLEVSNPGYVQAPANFFDRRFLNPDLLRRLDDAGTKLQYRSIFLQGVLLSPIQKLPNYFLQWEPIFENLRSEIGHSGLSASEFLLSVVASSNPNAELVVGVNDIAQFEELISARVNYDMGLGELELESEALFPLIDPRRWPG
jgi:aryl-alcohol dehydrogenase-like predicted oxidoreductase